MGRAEPLAARGGNDVTVRQHAGAWRHLPNLISLFRIVLVWPAVTAVLQHRYDVALGLVFVAGLSDGLDGLLAKRFGWSSRLGAFLDPLADKLLFVSVFVVFAVESLLPVWLVVTVMLRDLVIVGGAVGYRVVIGPFQGGATRLSKLNTALLLLLGLGVLALAQSGFTYADAPNATAAQGLVMVGALSFATTVLSGVHYVASWSQRARRELAMRPAAD